MFWGLILPVLTRVRIVVMGKPKSKIVVATETGTYFKPLYQVIA